MEPNNLVNINISKELNFEFDTFISNTNLNQAEVDKLYSYVEKITIQHYVRELLKQDKNVIKRS
jgi:hypothetical protein